MAILGYPLLSIPRPHYPRGMDIHDIENRDKYLKYLAINTYYLWDFSDLLCLLWPRLVGFVGMLAFEISRQTMWDILNNMTHVTHVTLIWRHKIPQYLTALHGTIHSIFIHIHGYKYPYPFHYPEAMDMEWNTTLVSSRLMPDNKIDTCLWSLLYSANKQWWLMTPIMKPIIYNTKAAKRKAEC